MRAVASVSPCEMAHPSTKANLAVLKKQIAELTERIGDIVAGKRSITADTDLRLCRYFGLSDGWWLRGQANYDMAIAREAMGETLSHISRCPLLAA